MHIPTCCVFVRMFSSAKSKYSRHYENQSIYFTQLDFHQYSSNVKISHSLKGNCHRLLCCSQYPIKINVSYLITTTVCLFRLLRSSAAVNFCQLEPPDEHTWHQYECSLLVRSFDRCPPRLAIPFPCRGTRLALGTSPAPPLEERRDGVTSSRAFSKGSSPPASFAGKAWPSPRATPPKLTAVPENTTWPPSSWAEIHVWFQSAFFCQLRWPNVLPV